MNTIIEEHDGNVYYNGVEMPHFSPGTKKGEYILDRNWRCVVVVDKKCYEIWVKAGFRFDGASIPRALWRLCGHPFEAPRVAAALAHDWLYRAQVVDRCLADDIFNALCKRVGMSCWRTGPEWFALFCFGWAAWNDNHEWSQMAAAREYGAFKDLAYEESEASRAKTLPVAAALLFTLAALGGCTSSKSIYTNGFVLWWSGTAIGIGYGEHMEIAPGGKVYRGNTNDVCAIFGDERDYHASVVALDNTLAVSTNTVEAVAAQK